MKDVAELIVCERDGRWAVRLGRQIDGRRIRIRQTRSLGASREALELARSSLMVVELTADSATEVIDWVSGVWRSFSRAVVFIVAERELAEYRDLAIEAGAAAMVTSPRELSEVAPMINAHLGRVVTAPVSTADRITRSLPWSDWAT